MGNIGSLLVEGESMLAGCSLPEAKADASVLLADVLGCDRGRLLIDRDREIDADSEAAYRNYLSRRSKRVPLCYITGKKEFMGMDFKLVPGVFIPRPETELLVEEALKAAKGKGNGCNRVLDTGTGCGNIAVSLACFLPWLKVFAVDINQLCVELAKENAFRLGSVDEITFLKGDLFGPLAGGDNDHKFDMIVSNPPYIPGKDIPGLAPEVLSEPREALFGGRDGLDFYRRIIREAGNFLTENGVLAFEIGYDQARGVRDILSGGGYATDYVRKDYSGFDRIIVAHRSTRGK